MFNVEHENSRATIFQLAALDVLTPQLRFALVKNAGHSGITKKLSSLQNGVIEAKPLILHEKYCRCSCPILPRQIAILKVILVNAFVKDAAYLPSTV